MSFSHPTAEALRAAFEAPAPLTVGLEEELLLLDRETLEPVPRAREIVAAGASLKLELPACQVEIATAPHADVPAAMRELAAGRRTLSTAAEGVARPIGAGLPPLGDPLGELNRDGLYAQTIEDYASVARRQLVCAFQVHVAVGGADRTLAVHNALRPHLPELAALAANAPFHAGHDTGLASARPPVAKMLPRQGVPPVIPSWEVFAAELKWGETSGALPYATRWWWELRPHPTFGTLELRVPDTQATLAEAGAVAATAHALVAWLAERHEAGDLPDPATTWRIEENRWSAWRHGVEGDMANLATGERHPTRERLHALLDELAPVAARLGCATELAAARDLVESNGAMRQRATGGPGAAAAWLADCFLDGAPG